MLETMGRYISPITHSLRLEVVLLGAKGQDFYCMGQFDMIAGFNRKYQEEH